MLKLEYVSESRKRQDSCASCGKPSDKDFAMVRILFMNDETKTEKDICLCDECRYLLYQSI